MVLAIGFLFRIVSRIYFDSCQLGKGTFICTPSLSGLRIAVSIISGQLVAPMINNSS
jgi:hypothetical protein